MLPQMIDNSRNSRSLSMSLVFDFFSSCFYSLKSSLLKSCSPSSNLLPLCFISFIFPSLFQRQSHTTLYCLGHTFSFNSNPSFNDLFSMTIDLFSTFAHQCCCIHSQHLHWDYIPMNMLLSIWPGVFGTTSKSK